MEEGVEPRCHPERGRCEHLEAMPERGGMYELLEDTLRREDVNPMPPLRSEG
ncbi:hypothetical protein CEXT_165281, partial [Caerostris extrusa]